MRQCDRGITMPSTIYYVASLSTCVLVRANSQEAAREIGQAAIWRLVANRAIQVRTVRPAEDIVVN
jgi:hypothetical protein